ncbi:MAG: YgiT-type zinc finger protein [Anaerolineae bacterium]|nr:YgiT-type zinc finger protein [Anaerolineae bacterium]
MKYQCPRCTFGNLVPITITYVRMWGNHLVTIPNFAAWRCDSCGFTRYDSAALAQTNLLLGADGDPRMSQSRWQTQQADGPGESGPRRWSF